MSDKQIASAIAGLSGIAAKVFEAVPINEWWTLQQIAAELKRTGGTYEFHTISGCLCSMRDQGLVRYDDVRGWQRCAKASRQLQVVKGATTPQAAETASAMQEDPAPAAAAAAPANPMDTMLGIAAGMREAGHHMITQADVLESACLAQMEVEAAYKAQMAHFEQLRTLLAAIGKSSPA